MRAAIASRSCCRRSPEVAAIHVAIYKLAAVALPLADAVRRRCNFLSLEGCRCEGAVITNAAGLEKLAAIRADLPDLKLVLSLDGAGEGAADFTPRLRAPPMRLRRSSTLADDAAMMIYTSGTTGPPKGALEPHRVLLGHLPGVEFVARVFPKAGDRMWTPGGLGLGRRLAEHPAAGLYCGVPVVARQFEKFDAEEAHALMAQTGVRNAFIPPTALRMLRAAPPPKGRHAFALRTVGSGGESLGAETFEWGKAALGLVINEFYGQTECNKILGVVRRHRRVEGGRDRQAGAGPSRRGDTSRGFGVRAGRAGPDRGGAAGPGDVPAILEQAGRHARQVHRRLDDHRRPGRGRRATATSRSSAATTT